MKRKFLTILVLASVAAFSLLGTARAGGPVPLTVTNCSNETDLRNKLTELQNGQGGSLAFNCGTATIALASQLPTITHDTTIDGGGKITLSGNNAVRLFSVHSGTALALKNIVLEKGYGSNGYGGAISSSGALTLDSVTIRYSYTPYDGGAIAAFGSLEVTDSAFERNIASNGGAIYADDDALRGIVLKVIRSKFDHNTATGQGGAIYTSAAVTITNSEFASGTASNGGAIYARPKGSYSSITGSNFHDNQATGTSPAGMGGALVLEEAPLTLSNSVLRKNSGRYGATAYVLVSGKLSLSNSILSGNQSADGGIYNMGTTTLSAVTLSGNTASHAGGGIYNLGALALYNVTLSGNEGGYGGGLNHAGGSATLVHVTFSNNSTRYSFEGGGIKSSTPGTSLKLENVLVADSPDGNCKFFQAPGSSITNLSSDGTCSFGAGRDNVNLLLGPLAENGGFTQTHLPQASSPAIDGGTNNGASPTDQRGVSRPQGASVDVGAVEVLSCTGKPAQPILLKPGNAKKTQGPPVTLDWNDAECAQTYKVTIKLGAPNGTKVQAKGGLTASTFVAATITSGKTYVWRVIAKNAAGKSKSDWWTFQVK